MRNLVFNLDAMLDANGELVVLEVGPRAGGNCLPAVIKAHTGVDLVDIAIRQALGAEVLKATYQSKPTGSHATWMIHSRREGVLNGLHVENGIAPCIREIELTAAPGTEVRRFTSSRDTLGYALLSFPSTTAMADLLARMSEMIFPVLL